MAHSLANSSIQSGLSGRITFVRGLGQPGIEVFGDGLAVDRHRQRLAEPQVAEQRTPDRILGVEVGIDREMRRARLRPEQGGQAVALLALLEERVVLEDDLARLQVDLAGAGLDRDQLAVDDLEDEPVDVGQLLPLAVDAMEVRVALGDEAPAAG